MYPNIIDDYSGLEISFDYGPVQHYPQRRFVIPSHELLIMLVHPWQMLYELIQPKLHFEKHAGFPVKLSTPQEWIDIAQLLRQGKHNLQTEKLILDLGGRKLFIRIPSDKYCYDAGELPEYVVRLNVPLPNDLKESMNFVFTDNSENEALVMDPTLEGPNPMRSSAGKERLSYIDFYLALRQHYGNEMNDSDIVAECRRILSGARLTPQNCKILPVMLATMLGAEVSRNRACIATALMLLDLIETKVMAPSPQGNPTTPYSFKNALWHPALYDCDAHERRTVPEKIAQGELGGFFPMAHIGSWENEFKDDGEYQSQDPLTLAHVKSIVILMDWLCHFPTNEHRNIKFRKLNKADFQTALQETTTEFQNMSPSRYRSRNFELTELNRLVLVNFIYPNMIAKRFASFTNLLNRNYSVNLQPVQSPLLVKLTRLADTQVDEMTKLHEKNKKAYFEKHVYNTGLPQELQQEIALEVKDESSALSYIHKTHPHFTIEQYRYYKGDSGLSDVYLVSFFIKVQNLNWPVSISLTTLFLNLKSNTELPVAYRLIFCDIKLFSALLKHHDNPLKLINNLSNQFPIKQPILVALLAAPAQEILASLSPAILASLGEQSNFFFKTLMLAKPELFKLIIANQVPYKIDERLYYLKKDALHCPTRKEWQVIRAHQYGEIINSSIPMENSSTEDIASTLVPNF